MFLYPKFYKQTGVRLAKKLKDPKVSLLKDFQFPKNVYFHFCDTNINPDGPTLGIPVDHALLRNLEKGSKVAIFHQTDYSEQVDLSHLKVVRQTLQKNVLIKQYHRENPTFLKGFIDTSKAKLATNVAIKNHTLVGADYAYVKTVLSEYHRLRNFWRSVMDDVSKLALREERRQLVPIPLPDVIPSRSQLLKWETENKEVNWRKLGTEERYLFAEFYAWLKGDSESIFPQEQKCLDKIDIMFYHKFFYFVVNLGMLKSWIIPEVGKTDSNQVLTIEEARKFFLLAGIKVVMNTVVASSNDDDDDEGEDNAETYGADIIEDDTTEYGVLSEEETDSFEETPSKQRRSLNLKAAGSRDGIQTVEELLRIGEEKGALKKLTNKEQKASDADIFNSEEIEEDKDEEDLEALEALNQEKEVKEEKIEILKAVGYQAYQAQALDVSTALDLKADELVKTGKYSTSEIRRFKTIGRKWENITDPTGKFKTAVEKVNVKPEDLYLPSEVKIANGVAGVPDDSMLYSSLQLLDRKYIDEVLPRHLLASAVNLQKSGICVTDHKVTRVENAFDAFEVHSFKLIPLEGQESTIKVKLPIIQEDGSFMASGVRSKCRKQRIDLPIRKISHNQVALTSYVSKFFVSRSEKSAYSHERWLEKQLIAISNERTDVQINFAECYKHSTKAPIQFTMLSRLISKVVIGPYQFNFDIEKMNAIYGKELIDTMNRSNKNQIVVGKNLKKNSILVMAEDGTIFECATDKLDQFENLGSFEDIMGMDISKSPIDMLEVNISGKTLPLVFVLGYYLGLGNLLKTIGAQFDRYPKGSRILLEKNQFAIRFKDETLVFDKDNYLTTLIAGGFKQLHDEIKNYSVYDFDLPEVYGAVLLDRKITARYTKELDLMRDLWVDPITENVLREMAEPTDFIELLLSAAKKLTVDEHDIGRDERGFRLRGYERFAGFAYAEMVRAVRVHNNKPSKANSRVDLNPQAVWMTILQDQTTTPVEDSNPIHSLKEQEVVVYRGTGGRDGRTLNSESRKYHENSLGIISDATVDNGDAGSVLFLTANPKFKSVLGVPDVTSEEGRKDLSATQLLNTTSLLAPAIEFDD